MSFFFTLSLTFWLQNYLWKLIRSLFVSIKTLVKLADHPFKKECRRFIQLNMKLTLKTEGSSVKKVMYYRCQILKHFCHKFLCHWSKGIAPSCLLKNDHAPTNNLKLAQNIAVDILIWVKKFWFHCSRFVLHTRKLYWWLSFNL